MSETKSKTTDTTNIKNEQRDCCQPCCKQSRGKGCLVALLVFAILAFVITCCVVVFVAIAGETNTVNTEDIRSGGSDVVAVVDVTGVITENEVEGLFSVSSASSDKVVQNLDAANADPDVKAIVVRLDTPGGEVVASDIIYRKLREVRRNKPVIAYSSRMAASGGYYIAAGADEFIVHPDTITGSIGVILSLSSYDGLYDKLGIETKTFTSGEFKDTDALFKDDKDGRHAAIFQRLVEETYGDFVNAVADGRGMPRAKVLELGDGRIYSGRQAVENGLADSMGYFEDAVAEAEDIADISNATVRVYGSDSTWDSLLGATSIHSLPGGAAQMSTAGSQLQVSGLYYLMQP